MKYLLLMVITFNLSQSLLLAQRIVRGKITDQYGEALIGATIVQKSNITRGTITDYDGNFSLQVSGDEPQVINISFISYEVMEDTIYFRGNKVVLQDYSMTPSTRQLEDVKIIGRANRAKDSYMKTVKMKSAVSLDYISKETIKKTGDSYVDDAVKRVTGVSTVAGFITVRGLADRYIQTTINGSLIPTLNPLTNNIKLDMFPTSLIDNIVINKTQSPQLPGSWTGAYLSIETKDYPQQLMINIKTSVGYRYQSTFKNVVSSKRGPTDWLGYDNGFRDIDHSSYSAYNRGPNMYDELIALGHEEYLNSLGVNASHFETGTHNDLYQQLTLIYLNEMAPGYLNNDEEFQEAMHSYRDWDGSYRQEAWNIINTPASEFGQSLSNTWLTTTTKVPLDFSQDISIGNQINLFGRPFGFIAGLRYARSFKNDPDVIREHVKYDYSREEYIYYGYFDQELSTETTAWSALISTSYKFSPNHSLTLLYMPNLTGINLAKVDSGYREDSNYDFIEEIRHSQLYNERKQMIYQYLSIHYFPAIKTRVELNASYTDGTGATPDQKSFYYGAPGDINSGILTYEPGVYQLGASYKPERVYRYLDENILDTRISIDFPLGNRPGFAQKLLIGGSYLNHTRKTRKYQYFVSGMGGMLSRDFESFLNPEIFTMIPAGNKEGNDYNLPYYYIAEKPTTNFSSGYSEIISGYLMIDYSILSWIRIAGGLRVEYSDMLSDISKYYELGYPENDPRRIYPPSSGAVPGGMPDIANPGKVGGLHYLPSVNTIFNLLEREKTVFNFRLNYSKTIARPSMVEISPFYYFDIEFQEYIVGNPGLKECLIDNYDFRLESYFQSGEFISLSLFYKDFKDPIEMQSGTYFTWFNALYGRAYGLELEGKKRIAKGLIIGGNVTFVNSETEFEVITIQGEVVDTIQRAMFGQAPYIVNALIDYKSEKLGLQSALSYNIQGPKVALAGPNNNVPDIVELPRHMLDFKIAKTLGKHFEIELKIRNILNESFTRAYDYENYKYTYDSYQFGTHYVLSVSYNL